MLIVGYFMRRVWSKRFVYVVVGLVFRCVFNILFGFEEVEVYKIVVECFVKRKKSCM